VHTEGLDEPLKVVVRRLARSWAAEVPAIRGLSARGTTREECLLKLVVRARTLLGSDAVLLLEEEPPALVGISETAELLGWDRRKVAVYASRGQLPPPVAHLAGGKVWRRADIEAYRARQEVNEVASSRIRRRRRTA
jgi:predicted RNase H-like HicB family nuclease